MVFARHRYSLTAVVAVCVALSLSSCQQFFTASWGTAFVRDPSTLVGNLDADNAAELVDSAKSSPDLSLALLESMDEVIADASAAEVPALQAVAVDAAVNASGVAGAIVEQVQPVLEIVMGEDLSDPTVQEDLVNIVETALGSLDNLAAAGAGLTAVLPDPDADPTAYAAFVDAATPDQLAMAAVTLLASAAEASPLSLTDFVASIDPSSPSADVKLAVDLANSAATEYAADGGTGPLASILASLNLY